MTFDFDKAGKDALNWLFRGVPILEYYPTSAKVLFCGAITLGALSIAVLLVLYGPASRGLQEAVTDKELPLLVKTAQKAGRKYVIESLLMSVRLGDQTKLPRIAEGTITYTLFGISDGGTQPEDFMEGFHTSEIDGGQGGEVLQLPGTSDDEVISVGSETIKGAKSWPVETDLGLGQRKTLSTSVRWIYDFPAPSIRAVHMFRSLASNEEAFCYPNDEDVIGQLTIAISADFPLRNSEEGDARVVGSGEDASAMTVPRVRSASGRSMVAYTWKNIAPHTTTGLRVRW